MRHIKKITFTLLALMLPVEIASAEMIRDDPILLPKRFNIIAHTGQDPVYRSYQNNKDGFIDLNINSPYVKAITGDPSATTHLYEYSEPFDWSGVVVQTRQLISNHQKQRTMSETSLFTNVSSSTLPAPPAFLLFLAGIAASSRRRN